MDEYYTAVKTFNLSWPEIIQMGRDSLDYSFAQASVKWSLIDSYDEAIRKFEKKYGGPDWAKALGALKPISSGYAERNFRISLGSR